MMYLFAGELITSFAITTLLTWENPTEAVTSLQYPVAGVGRIHQSPRTACGDELCVCQTIHADCSDHTDGLQYIPQLPSHIQTLNFSRNHLRGIFRDDFFQNVTFLSGLNLKENQLTYINPVAFQVFKQLHKLTLDFNMFNYSILQPALTVSKLRKLSVKSCNLGPIPKDFFHSPALSPLWFLDLANNSIGDTKVSVFKHLKHLEKLDLNSNQILHFEVNLASGLTSLNLNNNGLSTFPATCHHDNSSLFPKLTWLLLSGNIISTVGQVCLPKLMALFLSKNRLSVMQTGEFSGHKFPSLTKLYLQSMTMYYSDMSLCSNAFSNPQLHELDLSRNALAFERESISANAFANCPNLRVLRIDHNFLSITEERFLQLFGYLNNLEYLFMENAYISYITKRMFSGFTHLKVLKLDRNSLSVIPDGMFDELKNLTQLVLNNNQISVVPSTMFNATTRKQLSTLDLSGNPFECSCQVLWFRRWLISDAALFNQSWGSYDCFNLQGVSVRQFFLDEQACLLTHSASIMIIITITITVVTLSVILVTFRYRWHFRLILYEAFRGRGDARRRRLETGEFDYDVFVSYDSDDSPWVLQHLLPELEGRLGLRLCLHQRDFIPGRDIVDNISTSVERSKKVVMLFSNNFVQSQWCQFELSLCLTHVMDYDDALIVLCLDNVSYRDLTAPMMAVMKTTTYIQWMDHVDAIASFWGRVHIALQEIIHHRD